jgi:hypothetical protein
MTAEQPDQEHRPGTLLVAATLRLFAVLIAVGAIVGVAAFRAELLTLVPFVGATGMAPPAIFAALIVGIGLLFWALAEVLARLAATAATQARIEHALAALPGRLVSRAPAAAAGRDLKSAGVGDVPGFTRYQKPAMRELKWAASVTNGPALLANPVCEVAKGAPVTAIGEVGGFAFVETPTGNGWLPKDALAH